MELWTAAKSVRVPEGTRSRLAHLACSKTRISEQLPPQGRFLRRPTGGGSLPVSWDLVPIPDRACERLLPTISRRIACRVRSHRGCESPTVRPRTPGTGARVCRAVLPVGLQVSTGCSSDMPFGHGCHAFDSRRESKPDNRGRTAQRSPGLQPAPDARDNLATCGLPASPRPALRGRQALFGGRTWVRTKDLFGVNEARYHCANRPGASKTLTHRLPGHEPGRLGIDVLGRLASPDGLRVLRHRPRRRQLSVVDT